MDNKTYPERIIRTRTTEYGSFSEVYTIDAWLNGFFVAFIMMAILAILIAPISSLLLFSFYCLTIGRDQAIKFITPILFSIYLIVDYKKNWIARELVSVFYDNPEFQKLILATSITTILSSLVAMIFFDTIYNMSKEKSSMFFWFMIMVYAAFFLIVSVIV